MVYDDFQENYSIDSENFTECAFEVTKKEKGCFYQTLVAEAHHFKENSKIKEKTKGRS